MTDGIDDLRADDRLRAQLRAIEIGGPPLGVMHQRVLRLADERRRRRRLSWLAGALAVLALPAGAGTLGLASSDRSSGTRLEVNPPDSVDGTSRVDGAEDPANDASESADATTTTVAAGARPAAQRSASGTAAPAPSTTMPSGPQAGAPVAPPGPGPSSSSSAGEPGTADEGCVVEGYDDRSVYLPNGGVGAGPPPSCSYVATRAAGYIGRGKWILEIERDGFRRVLSADNAEPCAAVGVVRAGDKVKATVRDGVESSAAPGSLRVGPSWQC